jgi:Dolichyl-phosphate-mannose-protein mannosyltransferase
MQIKIRRFLNSYWVLILLVSIKFILKYVIVNPVYELHRDEFLYLDQGEHLAFGYISVPPFTALVSKIIYLFGGSMFWIRFFPALFGALTIVFTWLIVEAAGSSLFAKILASCALVFSALARINLLYQPNSFDILTWTIIFYLLIRFIQSENNKWLLVLSVVIAVGFYNKYNLIFLLAGLAIGLLFTFQRKIYTNPGFWKALIICLILLAPNIIWQIVNHFPVFQHMKVLKHNQLNNNSVTGFLRSQLMFFFGSLPLIVGAIIAFFSFKSFKTYRFIGICFIAVIALFAIMKAKDYYAVGIYPVIIAFGSVFTDKILTKKWRVIIFPLLLCFNLAVFLSTFKVVYPIYSPAGIRQHAHSFERLGLLRWEDGKNHNLPQDFADMLGWREMADKSLAAYNMIPANERENTLVICYNYGQAGALNYFNKKKMPEAYAYNTDYIYWIPRLKKIKNILLVGKNPGQSITGQFKEFRLTGSVENSYARESGTEIYLLTGANEAFTELFYKNVDSRKEKLDIF